MLEEGEGVGTVAWTVAVCGIVPLLPVTTIVYSSGVVPIGTEIVNFDVADLTVEEREIRPELRYVVGPVGETDAERVTLPMKLPMAVTLIVDMPDEPCAMVTDEGLEVSTKSGNG